MLAPRTFAWISIALASLVPLSSVAVEPPVQGIDGVTARLVSAAPGGSDVLFTRDADGAIPVAVTVFQNTGSGWAQADMRVTLRVFVPQTDLVESDRASIGLRASPDEPVVVRIPASALDPREPFDLFVTFSQLGGNPTPTSHHSAQKNALLAQGAFDEAETFDFHRLHYAIAGPATAQIEAPPLAAPWG